MARDLGVLGRQREHVGDDVLWLDRLQRRESDATPDGSRRPSLAEDGNRIQASVDLRSGYEPTGRVSVALFLPSDTTCIGVPAHVEEVDLSGTSAATSVGFEVPKHQVGTWNWTAAYLGDANNVSTGSGCGQAPVEVVKKIKKK